MSLSNIYTQLGILFILMVVGYALGKTQVITEKGIDAFSSFIVKVAIPALIINGMMIPVTTEKIQQAIQVFFLSILMYTLMYGLAILLPKWITKEQKDRGIYSFAIMFSNVGFMGYPVLQAIFGKEAIFIGTIYNISFNVLVYTIGIKMIQSNKKSNKGFNYKLLINPGTVASLIGVLLFITAIPIPLFIKGSVSAVGSVCTPLSMITIGAMLSGLPLTKMWSNWSIYSIAVIRLLLLPAIVLIVLKYGLNLKDAMLIGVPVVITGMPVAANAAIMVKQYGSDPELASQCILITTLLSGVTIPLLALFFY